MEREGIERVSDNAVNKLRFLNYSGSRYFVYAMLAGFFCALGMAFAYSCSGPLYASEVFESLYKIVLGVTFALSFTLIVFAGSELFTGNVFVMTVGALTGKINIKGYLKLLAICYVGNLTGAYLMAWVYASTGLMSGSVGDLIVSASRIKMQLPFMEAVFRGIMCNILVCMATWAISKMKSEAGKLIVILWCVAGFVTPGYEHSIANMALFVMAKFAPQATADITWAGVFHNMVPVTIGNFIGGALFVAAVYWFISSVPVMPDKNSEKSVTVD